MKKPIPVDAPVEFWQDLAKCSPGKVAGGENILSRDNLEYHISTGVFAVLQPDLCKWGGFNRVVLI